MMLVTYGVLPHCHLLVASHELLPWLPIQCSEVSRLSTNMVAYVSPLKLYVCYCVDYYKIRCFEVKIEEIKMPAVVPRTPRWLV